MQWESLCEYHNVSRETYARLNLFVSLAEKWQKRITLVSNGPQEWWSRHIGDSMQLCQFINPSLNTTVADLGSGGGFPGIVLALCFPEIPVTLVESDGRKSIFLKEAARQLALANVVVENVRIEKITQKFSIITARALGSITQVLEYANPLLEEGGYCLFLKGENWSNEIDEANHKWLFTYEATPSMTSPDSRVLKIKAIERKRTVKP
jgi:16S rRNA (guanine527-N7)-methyltransferase